MKFVELVPWLNEYPDREAASLLRDGFEFGFFIPFVLNRSPYFAPNLKSAREHASYLREKIESEVTLGRIEGPFLRPPFSNLRVSPLGVVPKKAPGKYRLIHHLSFPKGDSVNDGIPAEDISVSYVSFDRAVQLVSRAGRGAYMAKSDIESAFRLLPVHPDCYHLLGCSVDGLFYFDTCLPMGCSISCKFFETFSKFLEWAFRRESGSSSVTHYLDDFFFVGSAGSMACSDLLTSFCSLMERFGVPLSTEKTEGPSQVMSFLGIEIDTTEMIFRLPGDKLERLQALLRLVLASRKVTLLQLQSLLGSLVFACRVMPMGRIFSRRLSLATRGVVSPGHRIRVTRLMRDDLCVWLEFLGRYNGRTCFRQPRCLNTDLSLFTDASGSWGFGAVFGRSWCAGEWPSSWRAGGLCTNLALLEMFPIVVALELWGSDMRNKSISFWSDNLGVVQAINRLSSASLPVISLLRRLVLRCLDFNIYFRARHVPGRENVVAEDLCPEDLWALVEKA